MDTATWYTMECPGDGLTGDSIELIREYKEHLTFCGIEVYELEAEVSDSNEDETCENDENFYIGRISDLENEVKEAEREVSDLKTKIDDIEYANYKNCWTHIGKYSFFCLFSY
jgi:predicted RNase H-like nuclease (RuvC/YqgF family)